MIPLRITADLVTGIAHASPWTITLDGLLASQLWREYQQRHPTQHALAADNPPDLELPLQRCTTDPNHWHWAATCGWPEHRNPDPEIHYWETHLDHRSIEHATNALPNTIHDTKGRWRAYWMPLPVTVCARLIWHAIGDPERIETLLQPITSIGKKRSQGEGRIRRWTITPAPELDHFTAAHLSPTGVLARPTPPQCLHGRTIPHGGAGYAAIRPPHMHPSRKTDVLLPAPH